LPWGSRTWDNPRVTARRRLLGIALLAAAAASFLATGACQKKKAVPGQSTPGFERRPYTPIPPPPTRTLKPGEPTPPPNLPG
jgi:hypothetical protein